MPYFAVLHQYEFNNLEIIISQRKKPFVVVLQLLKYNKTVKNRLFREVASLLSPQHKLFPSASRREIVCVSGYNKLATSLTTGF